MASNVNPEYLRRNLLCANAIGAHANAEAALRRIQETWSRPPRWLTDALNGIIERTEPLGPALACYRSAVPRTQDFTDTDGG
jgi:hypothetical protein